MVEQIKTLKQSTESDELGNHVVAWDSIIKKTLLEALEQNPERALQMLLESSHFNTRSHIIFVLIEQRIYEVNEDAFFNLPWTDADKENIRSHIKKIREKFEEYYHEDAPKHVNKLIETLFG